MSHHHATAAAALLALAAACAVRAVESIDVSNATVVTVPAGAQQLMSFVLPAGYPDNYYITASVCRGPGTDTLFYWLRDEQTISGEGFKQEKNEQRITGIVNNVDNTTRHTEYAAAVAKGSTPSVFAIAVSRTIAEAIVAVPDDQGFSEDWDRDKKTVTLKWKTTENQNDQYFVYRYDVTGESSVVPPAGYAMSPCAAKMWMTKTSVVPTVDFAKRAAKATVTNTSRVTVFLVIAEREGALPGQYTYLTVGAAPAASALLPALVVAAALLLRLCLVDQYGQVAVSLDASTWSIEGEYRLQNRHLSRNDREFLRLMCSGGVMSMAFRKLPVDQLPGKKAQIWADAVSDLWGNVRSEATVWSFVVGDFDPRVFRATDAGLLRRDLWSIAKRMRSRRKLPLRTTVAVSVGLIIVLSVLTALVPTTALWLDTLNALSDKVVASLVNDVELYRSVIINKTVDRVSALLDLPVQECNILLGIKGALRVNSLRGTSTAVQLQRSFYPNINDARTLFPHILFVVRAQSSPVGVLRNFSMVHSSWWPRAWNSPSGVSWTGPYPSLGLDGGYVFTYTRSIEDPFVSTAPPIGVLLLSFSMDYLRGFFSGLWQTDHGWAMLLNWDLVMLAASSGFPTTDLVTSASISVFKSPNETVRSVMGVWSRHTGPGGLAAASFEMEGGLYVDAAAVTLPGNLTLWLVLVMHKSDFLGRVLQTQIDTKQSVLNTITVLVVVELVVMVVAVGLAAYLGHRLVRPLHHVSDQMKKVINMEFEGIEKVIKTRRSSIREVYLRLSRWVGSLYVPTIVVRYLIKNRLRPAMGVAPMHATIMFVDVANFTVLMDKHGVTVLIDILKCMFDSFSYILKSNGTIIDKYIGDAIMAVWGCPEKCENSEILACKATIELMASLKKMNEEIFVKKYGMSMAIRVGLNSGEVYAGNVGSSSRLNYTVLGNAVNLAVRLEPLNKEFNTTVCVTDSIRSSGEEL
eukprot:m51a1_g8614 putative adenylate cyclase (972) ;mRNA; r:17964-23130